MKKNVTKKQQNRTIGERLKQLRGAETQEAFARLLGVTQNTVGRYERGERTPDTDYIAALYRHTGVNTRWLILGGDEPIYDDERLVALEIAPGMKGKDIRAYNPSAVRAAPELEATIAKLQTQLAALSQERDEARASELRAKDEVIATLKAALQDKA